MKKVDIESKTLTYIIGSYKIYTTEVNNKKISFSINNYYKSVNIDRSILLKKLDSSKKLKQFKRKENFEVFYSKVPFKIFETFITNLYNFYDNNKKNES